MSLLSDLWALFFPQCCLLCGKPLLKGEEHVCFRCLSVLPRTNMFQGQDNAMARSLWGKLPLERAGAFLFYTKGGDVRRLLVELKYHGHAALGEFLGRWMASEVVSSGFFREIDCIVPVPLHPRRQKERGYNQSEMLAEGISSVTGIPVSCHLLSRSRYTESQTRRGNYERWMNMEEVFECPSPEVLAGKHILLVDDVMTTGATLVACADALSQVSGLRISVFTLALAGDM